MQRHQPLPQHQQNLDVHEQKDAGRWWPCSLIHWWGYGKNTPEYPLCSSQQWLDLIPSHKISGESAHQWLGFLWQLRKFGLTLTSWKLLQMYHKRHPNWVHECLVFGSCSFCNHKTLKGRSESRWTHHLQLLGMLQYFKGHYRHFTAIKETVQSVQYVDHVNYAYLYIWFIVIF